jgi:hypothetical protein
MSRSHIRGPGYSGSMGAPGYEVPYASNYDSENQFFTSPQGGEDEVFTGVSLPGVLVPPIGVYEGFQDARQGRFQLPGGFGALMPPIPMDSRSSDKTDWSGAAKIAIVAGAALALYFIFRSSESAKPVAKKLGGIAEKIVGARTSGFGGVRLPPKRITALTRMVETT